MLFWLAVVVALVLMWLSPHLRRREPSSTGPRGPTDGRTEAGLREAERARGLAGGGLPLPGDWGSGPPGS